MNSSSFSVMHILFKHHSSFSHAQVKSRTESVQLTVSKNLCQQNVKWKPTVPAHFYAKLEFGLLNTSIQLIHNSEKKPRPERSAVPISHNPRNVAVL